MRPDVLARLRAEFDQSKHVCWCRNRRKHCAYHEGTYDVLDQLDDTEILHELPDGPSILAINLPDHIGADDAIEMCDGMKRTIAEYCDAHNVPIPLVLAFGGGMSLTVLGEAA